MNNSGDGLLDINDGSRPSQLALDLEALGEREVSDHGAEARQLHRAALEAARQDVPPFDADRLRARAASAPAEVVSLAVWRRRVMGGLTVCALAAGTLLFVAPDTPSGVRTKGAPSVGWMVLHDGEVQLGEKGMAVYPGDRLQFTWAGDAKTVVLIGADHRRKAQVLWPLDASGGPVALDGYTGMLDGSVELDDAPGPEFFFAVFDPDSVDDAVGVVSKALSDAPSAAALKAWGDSRRDIDVLVIQKRAQH